MGDLYQSERSKLHVEIESLSLAWNRSLEEKYELNLPVYPLYEQIVELEGWEVPKGQLGSSICPEVEAELDITGTVS